MLDGDLIIGDADSEAGPFMATITVALGVSVYMVLAPAHWLKKLMQLTTMSRGYEMALIGLGVAYIGMAWVFERHLALRLARFLGAAKERLTGRGKKRKEYKIIRESIWGN